VEWVAELQKPQHSGVLGRNCAPRETNRGQHKLEVNESNKNNGFSFNTCDPVKGAKGWDRIESS